MLLNVAYAEFHRCVIHVFCVDTFMRVCLFYLPSIYFMCKAFA